VRNPKPTAARIFSSNFSSNQAKTPSGNKTAKNPSSAKPRKSSRISQSARRAKPPKPKRKARN